MKKTLLIIFAAALAGCGTPSSTCTFSKAKITLSEIGSDKLLNEKEIADCFTATAPDNTGLIEIKGDKTGAKFKIDYYKESDPATLKMLNVKLGDQLSEWRTRKGHDLFIKGTPESDTLTFIFGDRENTKVKGTITFIK